MPDTRDKTVSRDEAAKIVAAWKDEGKKVVFTNGCFDILHAGHVRYLNAARALGDVLVMGLNSDASVKSLNKSPERPLNLQEDRAEVLCALANVDLLVIFNESTPLELITAIMPDILVKGGDWAVADIVGGEEVIAAGGEVLSIPLLEGRSTTKLVNKIRALGPEE